MDYLNCKKYKFFKNDEEARNWGKHCYGSYSEKYKELNVCLNEFEHMKYSSNCVEYYCGFGHRKMNKYLRDDTYDSIAKSYTEALIFTILLAPPIPENIVVYRLVCHEFIDNLIKKQLCKRKRLLKFRYVNFYNQTK